MLFTKSMAPLTAEEFGEATLEVEVSLDSGEVQWMRQGVLLHPGAKYSLKRKGCTHSLTVHKLAVSDRGSYSCESLHDRTQAQLTVERECTHGVCALLIVRPSAVQTTPTQPNIHRLFHHLSNSPFHLLTLWLNLCI